MNLKDAFRKYNQIAVYKQSHPPEENNIIIYLLEESNVCKTGRLACLFINCDHFNVQTTSKVKIMTTAHFLSHCLIA